MRRAPPPKRPRGLREELVEHAAEVDRAAQTNCQLAAEALVDFARGHTKSES